MIWLINNNFRLSLPLLLCRFRQSCCVLDETAVFTVERTTPSCVFFFYLRWRLEWAKDSRCCIFSPNLVFNVAFVVIKPL